MGRSKKKKKTEKRKNLKKKVFNPFGIVCTLRLATTSLIQFFSLSVCLSVACFFGNLTPLLCNSLFSVIWFCV